MRCIYYQWNVVHKLCIACNLFYPPIESKTITVFIQSKQFEILQHQPRLLYTHRSKVFLRNDLEQSDSFSILLFYMNAKDGYAAADISTTPNYVFKTIESHH